MLAALLCQDETPTAPVEVPPVVTVPREDRVVLVGLDR